MNDENLTPFEPGQSGNPNGGSRRASARKYLRDLFRDRVNERLSPEVVGQLSKLGIDAEDLIFGDLIAMQVVQKAAKGDAKSIDQIISTEPKTIEMEPSEAPKSPEFLPSEAEQARYESWLESEGKLH